MYASFKIHAFSYPAVLFDIAPLRDEEDEMLQLAIQQSLLEYQQDPAQMMTLRALRDSQQVEEDDLQR